MKLADGYIEDRRSGGWSVLHRLTRNGRFFDIAEAVTALLLLGIGIGTYFLVARPESSYSLLTPPIVALLLVANLVPAISGLVLLGRRAARRRTAQSAIGSDGQLHVRLVAIFSLIASVPMLLVVIFASDRKSVV